MDTKEFDFKWELICSEFIMTYRARLPGGYLYLAAYPGCSSSMTFVPDYHGD